MVNLDNSKADVEQIRVLYKKDPAFRIILDYFASEKKNSKKTTVDRLLGILLSDYKDITRAEVIDFFRELEEIGCGDFLVGRKGHPSRFEWSVELVDVGLAASGEGDTISLISEGTLEEYGEEELLRHSFLLRPDLEVVFELPDNLTSGEARRLADFIKALPFD